MTEQTKQVHPVVQFRKDIKAALPTFGLRNDREQERMSSVLMVAVERDPELVMADRQSLIAAIRQCANHGILPDGNEATLQVYNTKAKINGKEVWIKKVQYQPMVRGIINRVQKSGKVKTFWAEIVYEGEDFSIDASDGERRPVHIKKSEFDRGDDTKVIGAYSVAKFKDGTVDCETMSRAEIEKVRRVAKTQKVWDGWFTEKAKVAVLRRHSKRLPLSAEDMDMILNRMGDEHDLEREVRDVTPDRPKETLAQRIMAETPVHPTAEKEPEPEVEDAQVLPADFDEDAVDPMTDEYDEGFKAHEGGKAEDTCPHDAGTFEWNNWIGGYRFRASKSDRDDE